MIKVNEIISFLGTDVKEVLGDLNDTEIKYLRASVEVDQYTLDWINPSRQYPQKIAEESPARVIIVGDNVTYSNKLQAKEKIIIRVDNPKLSIAKIGQAFFVRKQKLITNSSAIIHPEAEIGKNVIIGANVVIGKCKIGNDVIINANVVIYDDASIGDRVIIHSGAIIGTDGLGCERDDSGKLFKFVHMCGVEIQNDVEIGANCLIAKGSLTKTVIGEGTKINGLCFIAHNCVLGKNVWITGSTMLSGSALIEDNVTIYSKVVVREHISIGKGATIGMGAVVTKNIPVGETWVGNPAKKIKR